MRMLLYPHFVRATNNGGVPERFIGAVLKTVVRSNVPWVRIPPPPNLKGLTFKVSPFKLIKGIEATQNEVLSVGENARLPLNERKRVLGELMQNANVYEL